MAISIATKSSSVSIGSTLDVYPTVDNSAGWNTANWAVVFASIKTAGASITMASGWTLVHQSSESNGWTALIAMRKPEFNNFFSVQVASWTGSKENLASVYQLAGYDSGAAYTDVIDDFDVLINSGNLGVDHQITTTAITGTVLAVCQLSSKTSGYAEPELETEDWTFFDTAYNSSQSFFDPTQWSARYKTGSYVATNVVSYTPVWNGDNAYNLALAIGIKRTHGTPTKVQDAGDQWHRSAPDAEYGSFFSDETTVGNWVIVTATVATADLDEIELDSRWTLHSSNIDSTGQYTTLVLYEKVTVAWQDVNLWTDASDTKANAWTFMAVEIGGLSSASAIGDVIDDVQLTRATNTGGVARSYTCGANVGLVWCHMAVHHAWPIVAITNAESGYIDETNTVRGWVPALPPYEAMAFGKFRQVSDTGFASSTTFHSEPTWSITENSVVSAQFLAAFKGVSGETPPPPPKALRVSRVVVSC